MATPHQLDSARSQYNSADMNSDVALPAYATSILALITIVALVALTQPMGYPPGSLLGFFAAGTLATISAYFRDQENPLTHILSPLIFWGSIALFAGTAATTVTAGPLTEIAITGAVITTATLAGFAATSTILPSFGTGAVWSMISRSTLASLLLGFSAAIVLTTTIVQAPISESITALSDLLTGVSFADVSLYARSLLFVVLYAAAIATFNTAQKRLPLEILATANELSTIASVRQLFAQFYRNGLRVVGGYLILTVVVGGASFITSHPAIGIGKSVLEITTVTPIMLLGASLLSLSLITLTASTIKRRIPSVTSIVLVEVAVPAGVVVLFLTALSQFAPGTIETAGATLETQSIIPGAEFLATQLAAHPVVTLATLTTGLILAGTTIYLIPILFVAWGVQTRSLAAVATTAAMVGGLALTTLFIETPGYITILGVTLSAVIWEFGEYVTIAMSEVTDTHETTSIQKTDSPDGFLSAMSIHLAGTAFIAIVAVSIALALLTITPSLLVSEQPAFIGLVLSAIGLFALLKIFPD